MSEFTVLSPSNFDQINEQCLISLSKRSTEELKRRKGVNPTLDSLLLDEKEFACRLMEDLCLGAKQAAVLSGDTSDCGLVVVTPGVEVREAVQGRFIVQGTCLEAVTSSKV